MTFVKRAGIQVTGTTGKNVVDSVVTEERFCIEVNGSPLVEVVASSEQLRELGAGFIVAEGIAPGVRDVEVDGNVIRVTTGAAPRFPPRTEIGTSGGPSVRCPPGTVCSALTLTPYQVTSITSAIETDLWRATGGVHCSVLAYDGEVVTRSSDIGRHNTVDKVIGHAILTGLDPARCAIGCTGRQPAGMVIKASRAGIPIIISRAAATSEGIATADAAGITLVCFSRGERFTIYTHPDRIRGYGTDSPSSPL